MPWRSVVPMEEKIQFIDDYLSGVFYFIELKPVRQDKSNCNYRDHIYRDSIDYLYPCGILLFPFRNNQKQLVPDS